VDRDCQCLLRETASGCLHIGCVACLERPWNSRSRLQVVLIIAACYVAFKVSQAAHTGLPCGLCFDETRREIGVTSSNCVAASDSRRPMDDMPWVVH